MVDFANFFFAHVTLFAIAFIVLVFLGFGAYLENRTPAGPITPPPLPPMPPDTYGSASFAFGRSTLPGGEDYVFRGVFFGKSAYQGAENMPLDKLQGAPVCSTPENHVLIVAKTRTGKGTRVIIPTLLRDVKTSALVIDPKGENAAVTADARRFPIPDVRTNSRVINPWGVLAPTFKNLVLGADTYNPLDILDRNDPNVVGAAQALAAAICPIEKGGKDTYWTSSAATVLTAVLLWLTDQPGEEKTLGRARVIVTKTRKQFQDEFLSKMAASTAFGGAIQEHAAPFIDLAQETYSGVMSNLAEHTKFLSDPQIKAATATSTVSMTDLLTKNSTFYLVIPPEKMDVQRTWLRLMITAALQTYKNPPAGLNKRNRCLFLIDELPALGRLDDLPRDIATMAGYGVDFCLIVQGLSQLREVYGNDADTIINNCAYQWYCNINDLQTAEYLSKTLGKKTVETTSTSDSESASTTLGKGGSTSKSESKSLTGRPLLMPDEILNLGRDVAILIAPGERPHYLRPVDYWNLTTAFQSLRQKYPSIYWNPPLKWGQNPLHH